MAQSFPFTAKIITKYSSERFLSICGQKRLLKVLYITTDNRSDQLLQILQTSIKSRIIKNYLDIFFLNNSLLKQIDINTTN